MGDRFNLLQPNISYAKVAPYFLEECWFAPVIVSHYFLKQIMNSILSISKESLGLCLLHTANLGQDKWEKQE